MFFSLPVLTYHSISRRNHHLCVSPEQFDDHCRVLKKDGWRGISLAEAEDYFLKGKRPTRKAMLFTFDDGYLDNYVRAEPILAAHNHHGIMFPIASFMREAKDILPNQAMIAAHPERAAELPHLDRRLLSKRLNVRAANIQFCSWAEIVHMQKKGVMDSAPHSMRHARVVSALNFTELHSPANGVGAFGLPPYEIPYGFPWFPIGHELTHQAFRIAPDLFELIKAMVPQTDKEARAFLAKEENRESVVKAIHAQPVLGVMESEEEYRQRIAKDFVSCRETFRQKLGRNPVSFCWPWGSYNKIALEEARKVGFRVFYTTGRGVNLPISRNHVHRLSVRGETEEELLQKVRFMSHTLLEGALGVAALWA